MTTLRPLFLIGVCMLPGARLTAQEDVPSTRHSSRQEIEAVADSLLMALHTKGLFNGAVVLGRTQEPLYARGFGPANVDAGAPFTPETPADAASVAKTFTAAAVLMLEEEGKLRLEDPVRQHLPEYPHEETLIRHLLSHSSGLPEAEYDFFAGLIPANTVRTTSLFLDILRERNDPPEFQPGTRFRYSSLGFDVAALLVERVTGQSWEEFLRVRVFEPLGMHTTFLRPARLAAWTGVRTLSYRRSPEGLVVHDVFDNEGFYGGSNLYSSARDLYRWSRSFYTRPVLSKAMLRRGAEAPILRDPIGGRGGRSALNLWGWYYAAGRRYQYPGALQGFWTSVYRDEEQGYSVVYISNNSMPQWLRPLLTRALTEILEGRRPDAIDAFTFVELDADDLPRLAGAYRVPGVGRVEIEIRGQRAFVRIGEEIEYPAVLFGDGQLYVPGLDVWIGFPGAEPREFKRLSWLSVFRVAEGRRIR